MSPRKLLVILFPALITALLFTSFHLHVSRDFSGVSSPLLLPLTASITEPKYAVQRAIFEDFLLPPSALKSVTESVLFPDWEVFVVLPPNLTPGYRTDFTCLFQNGDTSTATYTGRIPSSNRDAFSCKMPERVQRQRPFYTPTLIESGSDSDSDSDSGVDPIVSLRPVEMIRQDRFVYDSLSTTDDVIVFAKGVNRHQGRDRPARDVTCFFTFNGAVVAVTNSTVSAQEVFRCPHPTLRSLTERDDVRVSVKVAGNELPIPSLASYHLPKPANVSDSKPRSLACACTMVRNVAKFLREWVAYHAAVGIERFVLYDNGSDDDLESLLTQLREVEGYDVSSVYWPWQKTQEAGFSHCMAAHRDSCKWMAFFDVDEFVYSPSWAHRSKPDRSMIQSLFPAEPNRVGQVMIGCMDFGPSGLRAHPKSGVTQGYTCRWVPPKKNNSRRSSSKDMMRHKSIVRAEAVSETLKTVVHHFEMGPGWGVRKVGSREGVVNHYKYQAWSEFRVKFRRRVSAYVADWSENRNLGSRDRTPGLGVEEVEPSWWAHGKCEVKDTRLRDMVRNWFAGPSGNFAWVQ